MKKLIVITDWGKDTLACQEFRSTVEGFLKEVSYANINFVLSSPVTINSSYVASQIILTEERFGRPLDTIIYIATDPRINFTTKVKDAQGSDFLIARLKSGIIVCGPNAGNNFSYCKPKIDELFIYPGLNKGSQFRARDFYARICAHLMDEMEDDLDLDEVLSDVIPAVNEYLIGNIDNFGNINTTIRKEDFKGKYEFGDLLKIKINNIVKQAKYVDNLFGGELGELVIYPGSSGSPDNPYLEITIRRHFTEKDTSTGWEAFSRPRPGDKIILI